MLITSCVDKPFKSLHSDLSYKFSQLSLVKTLYYNSFVDNKYRYADDNCRKERFNAFASDKSYVICRKNKQHLICCFCLNHSDKFPDRKL